MAGTKNVRGAKAHGVGKQGNPAPYGNMPANNITDNKPKLGTTNMKTSIMGETPRGKSNGSVTQSSKGGKVNMPSNNTSNAKVTLGSTHHGVGEVPGYLKNK